MPQAGPLYLLGMVLTGLGWATTGIADHSAAGNSIVGRLDGEPVQWVVHADMRSPSAVFSTLLPGVHQVRIVAYRDQRPARKHSLTLEFVLLERGVEQLQILYYPFDPMHPRFSAGPDHGSARLQIESFEPGVGGARLKASLRGELFYHQSPNTRPIPHRTMSLDLTIDTEMVRN
ncbi:MAG: hypothetical protein GW900_02710 [Gammaproteobacteria bacterium]|nr:hypothetical protein [Gammaproteobacteria bacterium]